MVEVWKLTNREKECLENARGRLAGAQHSLNKPSNAIQCLSAKHWNLDHAEHAFRQMIEWRIKVKADTILKNPTQYSPHLDFLHHYPMGLLEHFDRDGDPIFLSRSGAANGIGFFKRHVSEGIVQFAICIRKKMLKWINEENPNEFKQLVIVEDLHGLNRRQHFHPHLLLTFCEIMRLDQENHAESAKAIVLIRAPSIFRLVWNVIKPFFDS